MATCKELTQMDGEESDDSKRKRDGKKDDQDENPFTKSRKLFRSPAKKDCDNTELKEMMIALMNEVKGIRKDQQSFQEEIRNLKKENCDNNDDHRRDNMNNATETEKKNREEQSQDDLIKELEGEMMNSFERELVRRHDRQQKMNRSTVAKQSTLVEEEMKEYSENEEEKIGEKQSQEEEVDNIKEGWQSIEESVLATIFLDEYQDGEIINNKKRKAESMERINDLKRERLEESIRFPNESKQ
ncbi:uncharacterized protein LOC126891137 [Diabrotica virgifera virgifera]|uniref:Uncharacterized protein n=1 Tax=Diabrotica virgifera virgifera TaxID=50390 RepID=A0ABM5L1F3_DIAVI|nr:uncharacterized protein LOC126891137 [Diabrotica virgifera virgifera]